MYRRCEYFGVFLHHRKQKWSQLSVGTLETCSKHFLTILFGFYYPGQKKNEPCCWCIKSEACDIEESGRLVQLRNRKQTLTCDCRDFTHWCIAVTSDCRFFDTTWCITTTVLFFFFFLFRIVPSISQPFCLYFSIEARRAIFLNFSNWSVIHTQIFFETFNVPALFISMQAVLSLWVIVRSGEKRSKPSDENKPKNSTEWPSGDSLSSIQFSPCMQIVCWCE